MLREDPLNPLLLLLRTELLLATADPAGESDAQELLKLHPDFWIAMGWLSAYYLMHGRVAEARTYAEHAYRLVPRHFAMIGLLAAIADRQGDAATSDSLRRSVGPDEALGVPTMHVSYHLAKGDYAAAAAWMEKCIEQRDTRAPWVMVNLFGPGFTASSHWPPLARKMNLPGF